jgi:DNA-binding MarR family transcriptional regulator
MNYLQAAQKMSKECPAMRARQASRVFGKFFDDAFRSLGLQLSQLPLLCAVALFGDKGASISKLARGMVIDPTTLTRNIRPLERAGLLRVARSPDDARTRVVFLTRAGEQMIEEMYPAWQRALKKIQSTFGAQQVDALRSQLATIVTAAGGYAGPKGATAQR